MNHHAKHGNQPEHDPTHDPAHPTATAPESLVIDRIISSTALRARTTAEAFGTEFDVPVELDVELYHAPARTLLRKAAATDASSVMVVAHNPGISELAALLSNDGISHMPTCAVACFVWEVDSWNEAITHPTEVWSFDSPKSHT